MSILSDVDQILADVFDAMEHPIISLRELWDRPKSDGTSNLLDPLVRKSGLALLAGAPDTGKSMLACSLALHVAQGVETFLEMPLNVVHQRSLFIATEDNPDDIEQRTQMMANAFESVEDAKDRFRLIPAQGLTPAQIKALAKKALADQPVDLIVVDGFADTFEGRDGNSNMDVRKSLQIWKQMAADYGCVILFLGHINKASYDKTVGDQGDVQGAAALVQVVRTVLDLRRTDDGYCLLSVSKGNNIPSSLKKKGMKLSFDESTLVHRLEGESILADHKRVKKTKLPVNLPSLFQSGEVELKLQQLTTRVTDLLGYVVTPGQVRDLAVSQLLPSTETSGYYRLPAFS